MVEKKQVTPIYKAIVDPGTSIYEVTLQSSLKNKKRSCSPESWKTSISWWMRFSIFFFFLKREAWLPGLTSNFRLRLKYLLDLKFPFSLNCLCSWRGLSNAFSISKSPISLHYLFSWHELLMAPTLLRDPWLLMLRISNLELLLADWMVLPDTYHEKS